jgi:predicted TIM-barrel fold metal-dependent hydrolase
MKPFVFSADSHIGEPRNLFTEGLPEALQGYALATAKTDTELQVRLGERIITRHKLNDGVHGTKRYGGTDLALRKQDMAADGIDAEILFPQLGLMIYQIENPEAEALSSRLYNDWTMSHVSGDLDRWVPAAVLPVRDLKHTVKEFERVVGLGYHAAMLPMTSPDGVLTYNHEEWDPVFAVAQAADVPLVLHCGTGLADPVVRRGAGGAIFNYTHLMCSAMDAITSMVGGGVLDRYPEVHVVTVESGASWLPALAERMDEVYHAHQHYVRPKLAALPSEIVARQIHCSFQFDRAGIIARKVLGHQTLIWGADYPHLEGTFPKSKEVLGSLFDGIDISEAEKADIIGGTAARLFKFDRHAGKNNAQAAAAPVA